MTQLASVVALFKGGGGGSPLTIRYRLNGGCPCVMGISLCDDNFIDKNTAILS